MSTIEDVKSRLDIVELVNGYVPLKKAGRNFKALCPFHQEKTPSFIVFPESQHYHCFGCGASGDAFTFVMQTENVEFPEALRQLARRVGVVLRPPTDEEKQIDRQRQRLQELNLAAAQFFHHQLLYGDAGAAARSYLEERAVTGEAVQTFMLGYAPDRWDALLAYLQERGYGEQELNLAGVVVEREGGGYYDRFRHRLIFPIRDQQGHVIGFGGRTLDPERQPKYLNSPQTPLFDKGTVLYGLDQAVGAIRHDGRVILVEGYFDVLAAHQRGYRNVVAPMGTALTTAQVLQLKRLTKRLFLALDADTAGAMAMLRGLDVIREAMDERTVLVPTAQGLLRSERELDGEVRIVVLPAGQDPDEVIRADPALWEKSLAEALPVLEYVLTRISQEVDLSTAKGKAAAVQQALPLLAEIHDPVEQAHYVQRLAHLVQVDERAILAQLGWGQPAPTGRPRRRAPRKPLAEVAEIPFPERRETIAEGFLLVLLYRFPQLWYELPEQMEALLSQEEHRVLLSMLSPDSSPAPETWPGELRDYLQGLLTEFQSDLDLEEMEAHQALSASLNRLQQLVNIRQRKEYSDVLVQAQEEGNRRLAAEVMGLLSRLSQQRWEIAMPPPRKLFPDARRYLDEEDQALTPDVE